LIGLRSQLLTDTRGTALIHSIFEGWMEYGGEDGAAPYRCVGADRSGPSTAFALWNIQERGELFIGATIEVYEGMIVARIRANRTWTSTSPRKRNRPTLRSSSADEAIPSDSAPRAEPGAKPLSSSADDEFVEITPKSIRLRKKVLQANKRPRRWQGNSRQPGGHLDQMQPRAA